LSSRTVFGAPTVESEILGKVHDRIVQDFLDLVILLEMRKRSLSCHDVIDFAQRRFCVSLSSNAVSSHFGTLEKDGLVKTENSQGTTVYALTERGNEAVRVLPHIRDKILGLLLNLFISE